MTEERLARIKADWQEREPGFYAREGNWKMAALNELITEVERLRTAALRTGETQPTNHEEP